MASCISKAVRSVSSVTALVSILGLSVIAPAPANAESRDALDASTPIISTQNTHTIRGERYVPGIWVNPNGCDHWIIDDYLSGRLDKYGKPVCSGVAPPTIATGDFKQGSADIIGDPL